MLTQEQTQKYLERIGLLEPKEPSREYLDELIWAHQLSVPFENLDMIDFAKPTIVTVEHLYDKVVERRRGGYCFELNGIFCELLVSLGFDSVGCIARVRSFDPNAVRRLHRVSVVTLDGEQLFADVGFGGAMPPVSVPMDGSVRSTFKGDYCFAVEEDGEMSLMQVMPEGELKPLVAFYNKETPDVEFVIANHWTGSSPDSPFRMNRSLNFNKPDGFVSLSGTTLNITKGDEKTTREITTLREYYEVLEEYFGLSFSMSEVRGDL
ncbi:MAG: arylamine N-acetyltransferase [Eubacteriaceae bacterium]|nr:arylamine N-acetyltransferase [Eubacteriaceae bacterium]